MPSAASMSRRADKGHDGDENGRKRVESAASSMSYVSSSDTAPTCVSYLRLSPNEERTVLLNAFKDRRKTRLLQVREQEKQIAAQRRKEYQKVSKKKWQAEYAMLQHGWRQQQKKNYQLMQRVYEAAYEKIGEADRNAQALSEQKSSTALDLKQKVADLQRKEKARFHAAHEEVQRKRQDQERRREEPKERVTAARQQAKQHSQNVVAQFRANVEAERERGGGPMTASTIIPPSSIPVRLPLHQRNYNERMSAKTRMERYDETFYYRDYAVLKPHHPTDQGNAMSDEEASKTRTDTDQKDGAMWGLNGRPGRSHHHPLSAHEQAARVNEQRLANKENVKRRDEAREAAAQARYRLARRGQILEKKQEEFNKELEKVWQQERHRKKGAILQPSVEADEATATGPRRRHAKPRMVPIGPVRPLNQPDLEEAFEETFIDHAKTPLDAIHRRKPAAEGQVAQQGTSSSSVPNMIPSNEGQHFVRRVIHVHSPAISEADGVTASDAAMSALARGPSVPPPRPSSPPRLPPQDDASEFTDEEEIVNHAPVTTSSSSLPSAPPQPSQAPRQPRPSSTASWASSATASSTSSFVAGSATIDTTRDHTSHDDTSFHSTNDRRRTKKGEADIADETAEGLFSDLESLLLTSDPEASDEHLESTLSSHYKALQPRPPILRRRRKEDIENKGTHQKQSASVTDGNQTMNLSQSSLNLSNLSPSSISSAAADGDDASLSLGSDVLLDMSTLQDQSFLSQSSLHLAAETGVGNNTSFLSTSSVTRLRGGEGDETNEWRKFSDAVNAFVRQESDDALDTN